jgi:hypothetical protein
MSEKNKNTATARQRAIRRILVDSQRMKAYSKVDHTFSFGVMNFVDFETVNHSPIEIYGLKSYLRTVCRWLDWIETRSPSDLAVVHAKHQTRHVGGL